MQNQSLPFKTSGAFRKSLLSRCSHKIASIFAGNVRRNRQGFSDENATDGSIPLFPSDPIPEHAYKIIPSGRRPSDAIAIDGPSTSFPFSRLPYDVRVIIYHYLEHDQPLAPKIDCPGLHRSCRHFKREIEEFARDRLRNLCSDIENTISFEVAIKLDQNDSSSITVVLQHAAFDDFKASSSHPRWKREVLNSLHPLFACPFDTLRIGISNEKRLESNVSSYRVERTLRSLMRDLSSTLEHANGHAPQAPSTHAQPDHIFKPNPTQQATPYPTAAVKARRICLSWDSRPHPHSPAPLLGRLIYTEDAQPTSKPKRLARTTSPWPPLRPPNPHTLIVYQLSAADGLVAELGIVSPTRWPRHTPHALSATRLLDAFDVRRGSIVSSEGLGRELENGVAGVRVQELEDAEDRRCEWEQKNRFDDEVVRACIEEGYMPYSAEQRRRGEVEEFWGGYVWVSNDAD